VKIQTKRHSNSEQSVFEVIAVEMTTGDAQATFWVLGDDYHSRALDGLVYPDIVHASECTIVDGTLPVDWTLANWHYTSGSRTIIGPPQVCTKGFLENLVNSEPTSVQVFLSLLRSTGRV